MANSPRTPAISRLLAPPRILGEAEWRSVVAALKLSPRQAEIVSLILEGKKDKQITAELKISVWTVRTHLTRIFARVGAADRMELALLVFARARGTSAR